MATSESSPENALPNTLPSSGTQKRNRIQLSCTLCRQAKLKCNRVRPSCDQCMKRARTDQCYYAPPPVRRQPPQDMRGRVRHLERLVVDLMQSKGNPSTNGVQFRNGARTQSGSNGDGDGAKLEDGEPTAQESISHDLGRMTIGKNEAQSYVGSSHWAAILKDIEDVKEYLDEDQDEPEDNGRDDSPSGSVEENPLADPFSNGVAVAVGHAKMQSKSQLLDAMPEKPVVDRLVLEWFNSYDPFLHLIHAPTFQDEYKNFWKDPQRTPTIWIGLLCGIMSLAVFFRHRAEGSGCQPPRAVMDTMKRYRTMAESAMVIADYTTGKPYTIECMMVTAANQHLLSVGNQCNVWVMLGLTIRLALRMGFHRDPSHFPEIGFMQGEMRRRVWHLLTQLDVLISFQLGLPSMIRSIPSDIKPPHNLLDADFDMNTKEPPQPRPLSEMTPVSYSIAKWRICAVFAEACDASLAVTEPSYAEVLDLDKRMREAYGLIPPTLRVRPMDQSVTDTPEIIMCRFNLELLYLKSQCVLHRRFLNESQTDTRHTYSRKTCLEAAFECLKYHKIIHDAVQSGGHLERFRWYMSSITSHNFLLAAMIICLELTTYHEADATAANAMREQLSWNQDEAIALLKTSYVIWKSVRGLSKDSAKACGILGVLLRKVKAIPTSTAPGAPRGTSPNSSEGTIESFDDMGGSEPSSLGGFDMITPQVVPPDQAFNSSEQLLTSNPNDFAPIGDMLDVPTNIDWSLWDNQVNTYATGPPNSSNESWPMDFDMTDALLSNSAFMPGPEDFAVPDTMQRSQNRF